MADSSQPRSPGAFRGIKHSTGNHAPPFGRACAAGATPASGSGGVFINDGEITAAVTIKTRLRFIPVTHPRESEQAIEAWGEGRGR